jgi:hypothetical protein
MTCSDLADLSFTQVALETLPNPPQPVALAEPEFAEAVQQALRQLAAPTSWR